MRVLHLPERNGRRDRTGDLPALREQRAVGIDNHVLTLSSDPHPPVVPFGGHVVHRARLDLQLASTGFSLSVFKQFRELAAEADVVNYHFPGRSWTWCISSPV